jgi:uncharacterized protein YbaR (Trm112 family)
MYVAESVSCTRCRASYPVRTFSEDDIDMLEEHARYRDACEELEWLRRVSDFYERYPDAKDTFKPGFLHDLGSENAEVRKAIRKDVPFDEIGLPPHGKPLRALRKWSVEDLKVLDYLSCSSFSLPRRMERVEETIERMKPEIEATSVSCPACGGQLEYAQRELRDALQG